MTRYIQKGSNIDYKNTGSAKIAAGDVVALGTARIGIAATDIEVGATGTLAVEGVFAITKDTTLAISVGDVLYFNTTGKKITKTTTDVPAGWAVAAAAAADTEVAVKLEPQPAPAPAS